MNRIKYAQKKTMLLVVAGIFTLLSVTAAAGAQKFTGVKLDSNTALPVEINALVMEVNLSQSYIVIAEKRFEVTPFMIDGKVGKTLLADQTGNPVKLNFFKEGQRVFVKGLKLPDEERYVAGRVQLISEEDISKDYRTVQKLDPIKQRD